MALEMNEEDHLYDEFGNYIGGKIDDESDSEASSASEWDDLGKNKQLSQSPPHTTENQQNNNIDQITDENDLLESTTSAIERATLQLTHYDNNENNQANTQIILHEDKEYYKPIEEVYPGVETLIQEEDTQPLETPIIEPIKQKCWELIESSLPKTSFDYKFLAGLMDMPKLIRNIALIGHLHHGKTSFMDILVKETHHKEWNLDKEIRYTDIRKDEQSRGLSIKAIPVSLILPDLRDKNYLLNIIDCPGHVNFNDEITAALRLVDGAILIVDAAEGVLLNTERSIQHAAEQNLPVLLIINKIDRLIIELKLPPRDAYLKLLHTINDVNNILINNNIKPVSPINNTVCFASAWFGYSFTLESFAKKYGDYHQNIDYKVFSKKLWGDVYLNHNDRKFYKKPSNDAHDKGKRTFVEFILEPLYKIYAHVLGKDANRLGSLLKELGIKLKKSQLNLDPKPLLTTILSTFFGKSNGFVDMVINHIPSPVEGNKTKVHKNYTGDYNTPCSLGMLECNKNSQLMINITKMYPRPDASAFDGYGRIFSGTVKLGDSVRVLREGYSLDDDEDMSIMIIEKIWVYQGRYRVEVNRACAGNCVLLGGIDHGIIKTATLTHSNNNDPLTCIFKPLQFNTVSVMKIAIEPIKPSELPKMTHGLRCINKSYPLCTTKVEESGEHILIGTGELYLDCLLHDLRHMYSEIEIKVSDPVVSFCETVNDTSSMQCFAYTPNKKNKLTMICEPLDKKIGNDIENNKIKIEWDPKQLGNYFEKHHGWDLMAGRNIWAFGPDYNGPNILIDDTLPNEINKKSLYNIRNSIIQGFQWGTREGPLCDEPIRNCKFKLVSCKIADNNIDCNSGQIIPTSRRVLYSSFMLATPSLMEPILFIEALCPPDCVKAVEDVINTRRGRLLKELPKPGTPFTIIHGELPAIDSFGFETDLRSHTQGQAFCLQVFLRWDNVPGDPMDESIQLIPLEPQPINSLAREFMIKTRKRKGLAENVTFHKFFDDDMMHAFATMCDDS